MFLETRAQDALAFFLFLWTWDLFSKTNGDPKLGTKSNKVWRRFRANLNAFSVSPLGTIVNSDVVSENDDYVLDL